MKPVARWGLAALGTVAAVALLASGSMRILDRQRTVREINGLREELYRARVGADRCRSSLTNSESSLRELTASLDSLRARVDSFETAEGGRRGVQAAQYDEYLEVFDSYNDSVGVWEARERRLRSAETACRATIEGHNALSDSLQRLLANAGIDSGNDSGNDPR